MCGWMWWTGGYRRWASRVERLPLWARVTWVSLSDWLALWARNRGSKDPRLLRDRPTDGLHGRQKFMRAWAGRVNGMGEYFFEGVRF